MISSFEPINRRDCGSGRARRGRRRPMLLEEGKDLAPALECVLRPIGGPRRVEEGVAGTVVAVELMSLAELLEHRLGAVHLIAIGVLVVVAEQAEQGTAHFLGEI